MAREPLKNILLVEDDADIQEIARLALCSVGGFSIDVCSSGEEAIRKVQEVTPQLILLDVMMPYMDGPTTLKKIREIPAVAQIPIVFLTAKAQPQEIESYKKLGAIDVIPKPFDPMTLAEVVQTIWQTRQ